MLLFNSTYKQNKWRKTKLTDIKMESSVVQLGTNIAVNFELAEQVEENFGGIALTCKWPQAFLLKHSKPKAVGGNVAECLLRLQIDNNIRMDPLRKELEECFINKAINKTAGNFKDG